MPINWKTLVFIAIVGYGAWHHLETRPVTVAQGAGELAPDEPTQADIDFDTPRLNKAGYTITPLARYDVTARVLSTEPYYRGREADLSPMDFALGWGAISDDEVLKNIRISQGNRFYYWHVDEFPIPRAQIESHSANTHLIPASEAVEARIKSIRPGEVVHLHGYLVEVEVEAEADDGWHWKSSLSRNDTGGGACELMWVEEVQSL